MYKTIKTVVVISLAMLVAAPAFALETKISGFYQFMAAVDNFEATNNYVGTLKDNAESEKLVDQRLRIKLDGKVNESLSFVYYGEVDFQWGDNSYATARNDGGAIGGDTVNFETKNAYIDVKFEEDVTARFGLQGFYDRQDQVFFAADMAGAKIGFNAGSVGMTAGMFNLIEGDFDSSDNVYLWALQADFPSQGDFKLGADYYFFQNRGPAGYANFIGTIDIDEVLFNAGPNPTSNRGDMDLHYLGVQGNLKVSDATSVNGWLLYNTGTVDFDPTTEIDVAGYAASVRGKFKLGGADAAARVFFFSGDDDLTDGDADFMVNPLATESYAFGDDGFMIFFQDANWANVGQYGFALMDAAYAGYGLFGGNFTLSMAPAEKVSFNCGLGYFASLEDSVVDARTDRDGTVLGTELFVRAGYTFENNLNLSLNGAYAALGDFYDTAGGGTAVATIAGLSGVARRAVNQSAADCHCPDST